MIYSNTNRKTEDYFKNGQLPDMVYINKQNHSRKRIHRPLHRHESICEILLVYKGKGTYYVDGTSYPISEGSVIYYNQGSLHEVVSETQNEIGDYCIGITNLHRCNLPPNCLIAPGAPCVRQSEQMFPMLQSMCEQMYELEGTNKEGQLAAQLLCATFIILTGRLDIFPLVAPEKTEEEQMVLRIRNYLNQHFMEEVTLDGISEALGCSSTYVSHVFKKVTGRTPIQYIIQRRIGHAQTLLISTDYSVTQIATMVGYDNTNYFSTQFTKVVGMPPGRYRDFYIGEMKGTKNQS